MPLIIPVRWECYKYIYFNSRKTQFYLSYQGNVNWKSQNVSCGRQERGKCLDCDFVLYSFLWIQQVIDRRIRQTYCYEDSLGLPPGAFWLLWGREQMRMCVLCCGGKRWRSMLNLARQHSGCLSEDFVWLECIGAVMSIVLNWES